MAKVLKADCSVVTDSYAQKNLLSGESEVWLTAEVAFTTAAMAAWNTAFSGAFIGIRRVSTVGPFDGIFIYNDGANEVWSLENGGDASSPLPTAETWHTLEYHFVQSTLIELYVDASHGSGADATPGPGTANVLLAGQSDSSSPQVAENIAYVRNFKAGTTRGGTELFVDDFSSGDLSLWDSTTGDVSVIDEPVFGETPPPPQQEGICIAFDDPTLEPDPTWTRIDDPTGYRFATSYSISRGRPSELEKTGTGTATVNLIDKEGLLDPTNPSSPFAGTIDPMKQAAIALRDPVTDTWHTIFRGFISDWLYDIDTTGRFSTIRLELADAFDLLSALEMTPGHHGDTAPASSRGDIYFNQTAGPTPGPFQRITQILDDAGWPEDLRFILTGNIQLQASVYERLDQVLTALFDTADGEFPGVGNVYVDKIGRVSFRGRYSRFDPEDPDWQIDFFSCGGRPQADADPDNVAPISALSFRRSKQDIINAVTATPQITNGEWTEAELATMFVKDDASIAQFGWRGESFENLLVYSARVSSGDTTFPVTAVDEVKLFARYYVDNYASPTTRVDKVVFRSRGVENAWAAPLWAILTQIDIGDVLTVTTTHSGGGGFDADYFVEGLRYQVEPKDEDDDDGFPDVTLELDLSPRELYGLSPFS